jgi:dephospho-CoA kinase
MVLGLTGGIGSGKSTVARVFELLGAAIFDSDQAGRAAYLHSDVKTAVIRLLGSESYSNEGSVNRNYISSLVFDNAQLLAALNAIIHPAVAKQMEAFVVEHAKQVVIKETALLFETGLNKSVDKTILVSAPEPLRLARVMLRSQLTEEQVRARMQQQWTEEEKIKQADFVIQNDEHHLVIPQVISIFEQIK